MQHIQAKVFMPAAGKDPATRVGEAPDQLSQSLCALTRWPLAPWAAEVPDRANLERRVREILKWRRTREASFGGELFADPAWDMLLVLYIAELSFRRVSVGALCSGAVVPATTALRWITALENKGLILRRKDPLDQRRVYISLTNNTASMLTQFFRRMPADACI